MPLKLLIDSRRRQKSSLEVGSKCLSINREAKKTTDFELFMQFYCLQHGQASPSSRVWARDTSVFGENKP
jgi:hypothetical protein